MLWSPQKTLALAVIVVFLASVLVTMGKFHIVFSLVVIRNQWQSLQSKIVLILNAVKPTSKNL